jgi:hypothetical protein
MIPLEFAEFVSHQRVDDVGWIYEEIWRQKSLLASGFLAPLPALPWYRQYGHPPKVEVLATEEVDVIVERPCLIDMNGDADVQLLRLPR